MCFDWFFKKKHGISKPESLQPIEYGILYSIINAACPNAWIKLSDKNYNVTSYGEYMRFIEWDDTDMLVYKANDLDCDDFAIRLHGNISIPFWSSLAFGHMHTETPSGNHAVNWFVDDENNFYVVEPQNDNIFLLPRNWNPYFIESS